MNKKLREVVFLILGILSLVYYAVCIAYAWIGVSWLWLWPALSLFCFLRLFMLHRRISVPRAVRVVYYSLLILFSAAFIFVECQIVSAMTSVPEDNLDYIITLGAAVRNGVPTSPLLLRISKTAEYLEGSPDTLVIASGGQGPAEAVSEAESIRDRLTEAGISPDRILLEDKSTDTIENIQNSFAMIPEGATVGIVTSSFHLYRAMRIAELQGYSVQGIPAVTLLPLGIHYTVREFFAVVELELKQLIG